jgi:glycosyltransferase involved in cell wall biosynthesis
MKVIYYTSTHFLDISVELINILKTHVDLHVLIEITPKSKNANIINVDKLPTNKHLVNPKELLSNDDYKHLAPYFVGTKSVNFVVHPKLSGLSFQAIKISLAIKKYFKKINAEVIHFDSFSLRTMGLIPYLWKFKKILLSVHDPVLHSGENNLKNILPRLVSFNFPIKKCFIFYSKFSQKIFETHYPKNNHSKISLEMHPYSYYSNFGKLELSQKKHILFFGRISLYKGIDVLFAAMPVFLKQNPNEVFIIAGKNSGGYQFNEEILRKFPNNIIIIDRYLANEELGKLIRNAKFVVCPYTDATQSGVLMTAFAFNTPVIASSVGAFPEYIEDKKFGLLMKKNNPRELVKKMYEGLKSYETMSSNLKNEATKNCWANNRLKLLKAYQI